MTPTTRTLEAAVEERIRTFMVDHHVRGCGGSRVDVHELFSRPTDGPLAERLAKRDRVDATLIDRAELAFYRELERLVFECIGRAGVSVQLQQPAGITVQQSGGGGAVGGR